MRGIVTFKLLDPEWKGHWSFLAKDSRDSVIRPQTISFKRSSRVWTFIPDKEKQNYNTFTNANRKGKKQAFPEYQEYLSTHLKKYACEFCGLWNGLFYMENPHDQIKESFRLGLAYYGSVSDFERIVPRALGYGCVVANDVCHVLERTHPDPSDTIDEDVTDYLGNTYRVRAHLSCALWESSRYLGDMTKRGNVENVAYIRAQGRDVETRERVLDKGGLHYVWIL